MEIDFGDGDMQVDIIISHWKIAQGLAHVKVTCSVCKCVPFQIPLVFEQVLFE
jgi:hypothetical protein